jgi:predicted Zn finger-like uncharacterized protein
MLIVCPGCKTRFSFDETKVGIEGIRLRCNKCRAVFKVAKKASAPSAPERQTSTSRKIKVFVAHESPVFCSAVRKVLAAEPFDVSAFNDGRLAFAAIEAQRPEIVLLDVALPSMYGFEVCEAVRKDSALSSVRLILIASIYDKTRYKRSPRTLYGADDYIEKHHIPDMLANMIYGLVAGQQPVSTPQEATGTGEEEGTATHHHYSSQEMTSQETARLALKQDEEESTLAVQQPDASQQSESHVKAKRLARIIVSDIALYNQAKVEEGVKSNAFHQRLADEIAEGRKLYAERIPKEVRNATSYLDDAFEDLVVRKRRELGI